MILGSSDSSGNGTKSNPTTENVPDSPGINGEFKQYVFHLSIDWILATEFLLESIHVPTNHVPMIKIDCEVEDTKLVFVKRSHVPSSHQNELFEYYSSISQATI